MFEEENITKPWKFTEFLGFNNKVIEPLYECKTEYEWIRELAKRIDLEEEFTEGRDYSQWMRYIYDDLRTREPELPEYDEFREKGIYKFEEGHYPISFKRSKTLPIPHTKRKDRAVFHQIMENSYERLYAANPPVRSPAGRSGGPADKALSVAVIRLAQQMPHPHSP